jgi:hypothetical protein
LPPVESSSQSPILPHANGREPAPQKQEVVVLSETPPAQSSDANTDLPPNPYKVRPEPEKVDLGR